MPIKINPKFEQVYSKEVTTPNGYKTLGLFKRNKKTGKVKFIDYRVGLKLKNGKFYCPRDPKERQKIAFKLGIKI